MMEPRSCRTTDERNSDSTPKCCPVRAKIHTINGFSAHADQAELLAWHEQARPKDTFLVHGEESVMSRFAARLTDTHVEMPALNQTFKL